jgi:fluoroacetyl-CoA thioesterase
MEPVSVPVATAAAVAVSVAELLPETASPAVLEALAALFRRWEPQASLVSLDWNGEPGAAEDDLVLELRVASRRRAHAPGLDVVRCQLALLDGDGRLHGAGSAVCLATTAGTRRAESAGVGGALRVGDALDRVYVIGPPWLTDHVRGAPVLATPALVGLFEQVAADLAVPHLESGYAIVGVHVDSHHVAASAPGEELSVTATLTSRDAGRLAYRVEGRVGDRRVGEGRVEQRVVSAQRFACEAGTKQEVLR